MQYKKPNRGKGACFLAGVAVLTVVMAAGCYTPRTMAPSPEPLDKKPSTMKGNGGQQELSEAKYMVEHGDYTVVIPRLLQIISNYPNSKYSLEARYLLAVTYKEVKSYRDAIDVLNEYLRIAPEGPRAKECKKLASSLSEEYEQKYWTEEKLEARIDELSKALQKDPQSVDLQLELADLLWKRGDYQNAGTMYARVAQEHPEKANDPLLTSRIEIMPSGQYLVLTPGEVQRRAVEKQPLVVINLASFRSGEDLFTRQPLYYSVTGQAVNRSDSVLYGVQVMVTLYGFGNVVYDTTTANIGRLNPGESRAFSVRFSNFDDIENVYRYEAVGSFER
ncbi:MAG: FxLYD domain-containing protein [Candidatus Hydrogenedentes bacterium]|nr:FxLYD domain-containing protein [Candidatus Hydrogenedentota bacterium]